MNCVAKLLPPWRKPPAMTASLPARVAFVGLLTAIALPVSAQTSSGARRFELGLELGPVWTEKNDVRVPGDTGTKFDMTSLTGPGPELGWRIDGGWQINEKHAVRAVIAPFEVSGTGELSGITDFAGQTFAAGPANATYKFNTYKFTYRYTFFDRDDWRWNAGITGVIRDANIELQQGQIRANDDDLGFVPTLHLSGAYQLSDQWRLALDFDGLAGGPGRLVDLSLKAHYALHDRWRVGGGYRLLEGGVDIDEVYNFAWLNFLVFDVRYAF